MHGSSLINETQLQIPSGTNKACHPQKSSRVKGREEATEGSLCHFTEFQVRTDPDRSGMERAYGRELGE